MLGPLDARRGERPLRLGGPKQKALLAVLLLHAREVVSSDRLIDALWGEHPPDDAHTALHAHVSRVRKALEVPGVLVTRAPGYALEIEDDQLDLRRFERLAAEGRRQLGDGDAAGAAATLRDALALWRGRPLADLEDEPFAATVAPALAEARLEAQETRIEADLARGQDAALVPELDALVRAHPLRERPRAQLMLALYRSGRQAEALATYDDGRRRLAEELGLEPGGRIRRLQAEILADEPGTAAGRPADAAAARGEPARRADTAATPRTAAPVGARGRRRRGGGARCRRGRGRGARRRRRRPRRPAHARAPRSSGSTRARAPCAGRSPPAARPAPSPPARARCGRSTSTARRSRAWTRAAARRRRSPPARRRSTSRPEPARCGWRSVAPWPAPRPPGPSSRRSRASIPPRARSAPGSACRGPAAPRASWPRTASRSRRTRCGRSPPTTRSCGSIRAATASSRRSAACRPARWPRATAACGCSGSTARSPASTRIATGSPSAAACRRRRSRPSPSAPARPG